MPLKLSLKPGEVFIVNGAVVRNGDRRTSILLETQARVLREKDVMQPEDATTPAARAYFAVMQCYLAGETEGPIYDHAALALADLVASAPAGEARRGALAVSAELAAGDAYKALTGCRALLRAENQGRSDMRAVS